MKFYKITFNLCFFIATIFYNLVAAIVSEDQNINFGISAIVNQSRIFLGATSQNPKDKAIVDAIRVMDEEGEEFEIILRPRARENVFLNSFGETKSKEKKLNPIFNTQISSITNHNGAPAVLLATDTAPSDVILGPNQKIALSSDFDHVFTTQQLMNDPFGLPTSGIVKIYSNGLQIFAAVAPNQGSFGDTNSGIGMVISSGGKMHLVNAQTGQLDGNIAYNLDATASGGLIAIENDAALGSIIDMHWDGILKRLYVAISAKRKDPTFDGGAVVLLVGRIVESQDVDEIMRLSKEEAQKLQPKLYQLILEPVLNLDSTLFQTNGTNNIVGFFATGGSSDITASIYKVRTMISSTNKAYVILNANVGTPTVQNQIYALPVVKTQVGQKNGAVMELNTTDAGRIASKFDSTQAVSNLQQLLTANDTATIVGSGPVPIDATSIVQQIFVLGDSVFACLAGDLSGNRNNTNESGIFQSSAIIDQFGNIAAWTPWQRVMGSVDNVYDGLLGEQSGEFFYLTNSLTATANHSVVKVTDWGQGANDGLLGGTKTDATVGLVDVLTREFPHNNGGIAQIYNFDSTTQTFVPAGTSGNPSLIIAAGLGKIALIETGEKSGSATPFSPNIGNFSFQLVSSDNGIAPNPQPDSKVMIISGGVLNTLGPIDYVEVSRAELATGEAKGWIFVSSPNGVAVLSDDAGNGWNTDPTAGLGMNFSGINNTMSFKQLGTINNVVSLISDDQFLYVLTSNNLYKIALDSSNFSTTGAPLVNAIEVANSADFGKNNLSFLDMVISSKLALIATTQGLFRVGDGNNIKTAMSITDISWIEIMFSSNGKTISLGPVPQLSYLSLEKNSFSVGGNLYVLASDFTTNKTVVVRYYVLDTTSQSVGPETVLQVSNEDSGMFFNASVFRAAFTTDGALGFTTLPRNFKIFNLLKVFAIRPNMVSLSVRGENVDLDINSKTAYNIGIVRRDTASGAYIAPGDFGIRVNE